MVGAYTWALKKSFNKKERIKVQKKKNYFKNNWESFEPLNI